MSRETHKKFARRFSAALMILIGLASGTGISLGFGEFEMAAYFGILAVLCILPTAYFGVKTERSKTVMAHESPKKSGKGYDAGSIMLIITCFLLVGCLVCIAFDARVLCFILVVLVFVIGLFSEGL